MSFEDFLEFQNQMELAQKEHEQKEKLTEKQENDFGFSEVLEERQKKKDALKERLIAQNFTDNEIEKLFDIIYKAEEKMEKLKSKYDYKAQIPGAALKLRSDLIQIQVQMKKDFDKEFDLMIESKKRQ